MYASIANIKSSLIDEASFVCLQYDIILQFYNRMMCLSMKKSSIVVG